MSPTCDPLTGLKTRAALHELIERHLVAGTPFGIVLFDIDRFKLINYGFGDDCGDAVLQAVGHLALQRLTREHIVGRWSGQQFLCLLPRHNSEQSAARAEDLRVGIEALIVPRGTDQARITASFGVAAFPHDGELPRRLLAAAEAALYQAKEFGRNRVVQAQALQQQVYGIGELLDTALRENRIAPAYQPIVDLKTGEVVAEEALARLITPEGDVLQADEFIEVAKALQLTHKIDQAIITSTCARFVDALATHSRRTHFVNISGNLLRHPHIVRELLASMQRYCQACENWGGGHKPLVIEITEREFLGDVDLARAALQPFVDFGVRLALDDFGSGYSSFQYLADLPFSFLKIEGSLIQRLHEPRVRAIVQRMQQTGRDLGLITLAERVETAAIADIIGEMGIDWAQGHYYHRPALRAHTLDAFLAQQPIDPRTQARRKYSQ